MCEAATAAVFQRSHQREVLESTNVRDSQGMDLDHAEWLGRYCLYHSCRLGRGAYGTVYLCEDKKSGEQAPRGNAETVISGSSRRSGW